MKRVIILVALVAGLLAIPTTALAHNPPVQSDCPSGAVLGDTITSIGGSLEVDILLGIAGFTSEIFLDNTGESIGIADNSNNSNVGPVAGTFGPVASGEELVFRIDVDDFVPSDYGTWFTGPGDTGPNANADGTPHACVKTNGPGDWTIYFEDLDADNPPPFIYDASFDDAVFHVVQTCDPDEGECSVNQGGNTATLDCEDGDCPNVTFTPAPLGPDDEAAFDVIPEKDGEGSFTITMVVRMTRDDSTAPGTAEVWADFGNGEVELEFCNKTPDDVCIIQIKRTQGGRTQYTVQLKDIDPRFRFR